MPRAKPHGESTGSGRLFNGEDGTPLRPTWISIRFDALPAAPGVPPITPARLDAWR
jgi:hypothetical protein